MFFFVQANCNPDQNYLRSLVFWETDQNKVYD